MKRTRPHRAASPVNLCIPNRLTPKKDDSESQASLQSAINELKMNNFAKVPVSEGCEDAAEYTDMQLGWIRDNEPYRWENFDFVHVSMEMIKDLVLDGRKGIPSDLSIPLVKKRRPVDIISYAGKSNTRTKQITAVLEMESVNMLREMAINQSDSSDTNIINRHFKCMGLSSRLLMCTASEPSKKSIATYHNEIEEGFKSLVRMALRGKVEELASKKPCVKFFMYQGFLLQDEQNADSNLLAVLHFNKNHRDAEVDAYDGYYFSSPCCDPSEPEIDGNAQGLICTNCAKLGHTLRRKCIRKAEVKQKDYTDARQRKDSICSPSEVQTKVKFQIQNAKRLQKQVSYHKKKYDSLMRKNGMDISTNQASSMFSNETERGYKNVLKALAETKNLTVQQSDLISYICKQSVLNVQKAQKSGAKTVRFCPIVLKFATFLRSKMNDSTYDFLAAVSGWPTSRTILHYGGADTNAVDGPCYETIHEAELAFLRDKQIEGKLWDRMVSLGFDEFKVKEKIVQNAHTLEIIGFTEAMNNIDVLLYELENGGENEQQADDNDRNIESSSMASHMLIFMMICWDGKGDPMKRVVARYAVKGSKGESLVRKVKHVISALAAHGFIVNNVTSDGASENMSCFKQLATIRAKDIWPNLNPSLPGDFKVAFRHPTFDGVNIFIGGEMAHWVKKLVNALENSSTSSKQRDMHFKGKKMNLGMIEKVWREQLGGISSLRAKNNPLTEDHFKKNSFNRIPTTN